MANAYKPGGHYKEGKAAQEEELCRRSTLYPALESLYTNKQYPIRENEAAVVNAQIFRRSGDFQFLDNTENLDVVCVAGLENRWDAMHPEARPKNAPDQYIRTMGIITQMLRTMALEGHTDIVVGALGCGAFNNPPEVVGECFRYVLETPEFQNRFNSVTFAIYVPPNNQQAVKNFDVFQNMINNRSQAINNPLGMHQNNINNKMLQFIGFQNFCQYIPENIQILPEVYAPISAVVDNFIKVIQGSQKSMPQNFQKVNAYGEIVKRMAEEAPKIKNQGDYNNYLKKYTDQFSKLYWQ
jgi:hypothetical protein